MVTGIDTSSYYSDYYLNTSQAAAAGVEKTLSNVSENTTDEELMAACKEFEAYFVEQLYKGMEKTIMKADDSEESSSQYTEYFGDMLVQEYAEAATEQGDGIGLAKQLYEQMRRNYGL